MHTTNPETLDDWLANLMTFRSLPVPTKHGRWLGIRPHRIIVVKRFIQFQDDQFIERRLDLYVEGNTKKNAPIKRFGVLFSQDETIEPYDIPVLVFTAYNHSEKSRWILPRQHESTR